MPPPPRCGNRGGAHVSAQVQCAPRLTAKDFRDDAALAEAIYRVLGGQRGRQARSRKMRQLQPTLRRLVDDKAWRAYLSIEEAANDRADRELLVVARWAFLAGLRAGRVPTRRRRGRRA